MFRGVVTKEYNKKGFDWENEEPAEIILKQQLSAQPTDFKSEENLAVNDSKCDENKPDGFVKKEVNSIAEVAEVESCCDIPAERITFVVVPINLWIKPNDVKVLGSKTHR